MFLFLFAHIETCSNLLTLWAEDKLVGHVYKTANMFDKPIIVHKYEVHGSRQLVAILIY